MPYAYLMKNGELEERELEVMRRWERRYGDKVINFVRYKGTRKSGTPYYMTVREGCGILVNHTGTIFMAERNPEKARHMLNNKKEEELKEQKYQHYIKLMENMCTFT